MAQARCTRATPDRRHGAHGAHGAHAHACSRVVCHAATPVVPPRQNITTLNIPFKGILAALPYILDGLLDAQAIADLYDLAHYDAEHVLFSTVPAHVRPPPLAVSAGVLSYITHRLCIAMAVCARAAAFWVTCTFALQGLSFGYEDPFLQALTKGAFSYPGPCPCRLGCGRRVYNRAEGSPRLLPWS